MTVGHTEWWTILLVVVAAGCAGDDATSSSPTTRTTTTTIERPADRSAIPSSGCTGSTAGAVQRDRGTIDIGGEERWYLLTVPSNHDGATPLPLVVEFHGLAEGAAIAAEMSQLDTVAEDEGFVAVYPNGSGSPVRWDPHLGAQPNLDFDFVDAMLDALGEQLCIDEARVYATGLSYGAIMSSAMACARSGRFAAVAPVSGLQHPSDCAPGRSVPVLAFHGTADPILFFNGGVGDLAGALSGGELSPPDSPVDINGAGYPEAAAAWATGNGCGDATDERRSAHVIERTFDCEADAEVRFVIIEDGGHSWPGSALSTALGKIVGPTTDELDATEEIWTFFTRHALARTPG